MKRTDPAAFWARVAVSGVPDQCWEWQGSKRPPSNYGTVSVGGRLVPAHRRAWELTHGLIPVLEIRAARAAGEGPTAIARRYGVRKSAIQQIVNRETWTHV